MVMGGPVGWPGVLAGPGIAPNWLRVKKQQRAENDQAVIG